MTINAPQPASTDALGGKSPTLTATLRRAHRAVSVSFFVCGFGFANWLSRIPTVRMQLQLSDRALGILLLSTGLGSIVAFRFAGAFTRAWGSRKVASWGTVLFCLALSGPPLAPNFFVAVIALFLMGFFSGFMDVGMNTQALEVERQKRQPILSSLHGLCSLGGLMGAGLGALAAFCDVSPAMHLVSLSLPMAATSFWAGTKLLAAAAPEAKDIEAPGKRFQGFLLVLGAIGFCSSVGEGVMADWVGIYLKEDLTTSIGFAGLGYAFYYLFMVLGRLCCDRLSKWLSPPQIVRFSGLTVALGLLGGLAINTPWTMIAASMAVGAGLAPIIPTILRASSGVPNVAPSQGLATVATVSYGGFFFGPPVVGFVAEHAGLRLSLGMVVVLAGLLTLLAGWMPSKTGEHGI
jgi:MFS family permease